MSKDPDLERLNDQLQLMLLHARSGMDPSQAQVFEQAADKLKTDYQKAKATQASDKASEADKKLAKDVTDSINKNLPNFTKAALSAASAFKSGNPILGSAAIMDICASGAQMIGSLSSAAGPYGAAFGAVFTIIGQLLTYFGEKQPSLAQQITDAIKDLAADDRLQAAKTDGAEVIEYTSTIYRVRSSLPVNLKRPLATWDESLEFLTKIGADVMSIQKAYGNVSAKYGKWRTAEWLKDEKTQDLEKWPEVLGVFCRVYSDSLLANMALASIVDKDAVKQVLQSVSKKSPHYEENKQNYKQINIKLVDLLTTVEALPQLWNDGSRLMQRILDEIRPVAQSRGLFVHLGDNKYIYAATGKKGIQSDKWTNLSIGYGGRGHRFSIVVPKQYVGSLKPQYDIFFCEDWKSLERGRIKPSPIGISGQKQIAKEQFSDVWALQSPRDQNPPYKGASFVYAALDGGNSGSVKLFELDEKNEWKEGGWNPATKSGVMSVRAVTHPPTTLPDDPDRDGISTGSILLGGTDHYNSIIYGALRSSSELYVDQENTRCYVPTPWGDYSGVQVDPYYVWIFRPHALACATHASVISCIKGKRSTPRWMEYSPNDVLGDQSNLGSARGDVWVVDGNRTNARPPLKGILSMSPCVDGTIYASIYNRTVTQSQSGWVFKAEDTLGSYTTCYSIDLKAGKLNVDPWEKCAGMADQVQKLPIPCWSLFESLDADLKAKPDRVSRKGKGKGKGA